MVETVKVRVLQTFGLGGRVLTPGWRDVPAEKVPKLLRRKLIAPTQEGAPTAVHTEMAAARESSGEVGTPLSEDFPARELLEAAGLSTVEQVRGQTKTQLVALDGIGPATAAKILATLEEMP